MNVARDHYGLIKNWYIDYKESFVSIALRFSYNQQEADDIVSQFFLDLMEKNLDFNTIINPHAYLSTSFRRRLIDLHRGSKNDCVVNTKFDPDKYREQSTQEKLEQVEDHTALITQIRNAYKKLPARCQRVIYLKYYKGLSTEQIALQTNLTNRSVYNNLFEGVKILRSELSHLSSKHDFKLVSMLLLIIVPILLKIF